MYSTSTVLWEILPLSSSKMLWHSLVHLNLAWSLVSALSGAIMSEWGAPLLLCIYCATNWPPDSLACISLFVGVWDMLPGLCHVGSLLHVPGCHSSFGWGSDPCFHVPYLWKLHCVSGDLGHLGIDFILGLTSWCWSHGDCVLLIWCILDIIPPWVLRFQAWVSGYSVCWCPLRPVMTRFHPWPCRWHYWWGSHLHRWYTH